MENKLIASIGEKKLSMLEVVDPIARGDDDGDDVALKRGQAALLYTFQLLFPSILFLVGFLGYVSVFSFAYQLLGIVFLLLFNSQNPKVDWLVKEKSYCLFTHEPFRLRRCASSCRSVWSHFSL